MSAPWFDIRTGDLLIGEAAVESRKEEAGPDIVELGELLTQRDFPYKVGDYARVIGHEWSREEWLALGHWTLNMTEGAESHSSHTTWNRLPREHLERLHVLGLAPAKSMFIKHFATMAIYRENLGVHFGKDDRRYVDWHTNNFVSYAAGLAKRLGRKPKEADYDQAYRRGEGPAVPILVENMGGVGPLNEHIGYPNVYNWDEYDYLIWGSKVLQANNNKLSTSIMAILSKRDRGPAPSSIISRFGSISAFKQKVFVMSDLIKKENANLQNQKTEETIWPLVIANQYLYVSDEELWASLETQRARDKRRRPPKRKQVA